jgi:hypothetical protein
MSKDSDVHPLVRNAVIVVIWATILIPALALVVAVSAFAVRAGLTGDVVIPTPDLGPQTQMLLIMAVLGGYGFIVWMAMRETFGGEDVDAGVESASEVADEVQQRQDDL